jgi:hypothetical protein
MLALAALTGWKLAWGSTRLVGKRRRSSLDDEAYLVSKLGLYNNNLCKRVPMLESCAGVSGVEHLHITGVEGPGGEDRRQQAEKGQVLQSE